MNVQIVLSILVLVCFVALIRDRLRHRRYAKQIKAQAEHGRNMELEAAAILESLGHSVIERHPKIAYSWQRNEQTIHTRLEADYRTRYRGKVCMVEVKTGQAAHVNRRDTRRQLLEYAIFGSADEVWILNADTQELQRVEFPINRVQTPSKSLLVMFSASLLTNILAVWALIGH